MTGKREKKRLAILKVLQESNMHLSSSKITRQLISQGQEVSERTVRFYLLEMDKENLTENLGKRGRRITQKGIQELATARAHEKVGFLAAKIDKMAYSMTFDLSEKTGTVVMNASLIERTQAERAARLIKNIFKAGYAMGNLVSMFGPGERMGDETVPADMVGIGTVCSITMNGVFLSFGIPTVSRFGGLLEMKNNTPARFVEIIHYAGTTLDPLEIFIRSGMTDCTGAVESGYGLIGAGLRVVPAESRSRAMDIAQQMKSMGLGGVIIIGWPGKQVFEIPVSEGRVAVICKGGLNPLAFLKENGVRIYVRAMAGLVKYSTFFHYEEIEDRIRSLPY